MRLRIEGGIPLNGVYHPSGNANTAAYLIAASLLTDSPVTLRNFPKTTSTRVMLNIATGLGADIHQTDDRIVTLQTTQLTRRKLTVEETSETRALLFLAPMLVRRSFARLEVDFPLNRIRTHLDALRDLGFDVVISDGAVEVRETKWDYKDIILTQTSVTATGIIMMLAACFGKETVIHNAASEPHLQQLAHLLELMGAQVHGVGSNMVRIFGKNPLHGADLTIDADHIEAASIAAISALSGGRVEIGRIAPIHLRMIGKIYQRLGILLDVDTTSIFIPKHAQLNVSNREEDVDSSIETAPWPGFPSDLVAIATIISTQSRGTSLIHEKLYSNRLLFVDKLKAMGAQIVLCDPHRAIVVGPTPLYAIYMDSPDVRSGLGMLGAALIAKGETVIDNAQVLSSNFEGVITKLKGLGAKITEEAE
ncbi:MAG: UDP-N-acetylglucosamine 1-carboxyvinyltransferase [bacterium]|nr:UDP-N-acetylglucosamine 1-carboxyvinyltransferase [bacterium]